MHNNTKQKQKLKPTTKALNANKTTKTQQKRKVATKRKAPIRKRSLTSLSTSSSSSFTPSSLSSLLPNNNNNNNNFSPSLITLSKATLYAPRPRVVPAGLPKGLPPKISKTVVKLTPSEIQAEEDRKRYIVKEFYKSKAKWTPHPKLANCNNIQALEHYLWDHHIRLRWFRGKIADKANRHVRRSYFRTHISIHKKTVRFIEDKIFALKGELRIPKLYEPLVPNFHDKVNHFINQIAVVDRVPRDYDYPMKEMYEPLARKERDWKGSQAEKVKQI